MLDRFWNIDWKITLRMTFFSMLGKILILKVFTMP